SAIVIESSAKSCWSSTGALDSRGSLRLGQSLDRPLNRQPTWPITRRGDKPPRYTRAAMAHVFVAPHPDDVALSCGGLIASLRELGQNVTIITAYSGASSLGEDSLTSYQREALGFGTKTLWPVSEAFNRS